MTFSVLINGVSLDSEGYSQDEFIILKDVRIGGLKESFMKWGLKCV